MQEILFKICFTYTSYWNMSAGILRVALISGGDRALNANITKTFYFINK